jgi:bifunctional non-homologous end joining protein LigD
MADEELGRLTALIARLQAIEADGKEAAFTVGRGVPIHVSHLPKKFFPDVGLTKGDLMRYYVRMSPYLLPVMRDRALALKRFPDGVGGPSFFQQKAPADPPSSVRVETVESEAGEAQERLVGGSLATLLYCVQLGAIEVNPWNARVQSLEFPDYAVIDLDPGPRTPFGCVVETALWIKETLDSHGLHGAVKTSGSRGIHIVLPLPARTEEPVTERVAERIAQAVAAKHPQAATIQRARKSRGDTKVYLDYGQNARGKTVAAAYSVRAKPDATVSTPLRWDELTPTLDLHHFTIQTVPARIASLGDIWAAAMRSPNRHQTLMALH